MASSLSSNNIFCCGVGGREDLDLFLPSMFDIGRIDDGGLILADL